jgi:hypothetical protein
MPHLHSAPGIALRLLVLAGLALCGTSAEAAEADSDQAPPPGDTKLSGARAVQPKPVKLEAVVVGSWLPAAEGQTAQDIHIYNLERIEQSGQSSVGDFLATLPEVSLAAPQNATLATPVRLLRLHLQRGARGLRRSSNAKGRPAIHEHRCGSHPHFRASTIIGRS